MRKEVHDEVLKALVDNRWTDVQDKYTAKNRWGYNSVLMIGQAQQGLKWHLEDGGDKTENYPMASQTKFLTALTIYKMMQDSTNGFDWETPVHQWVPAWPTTGFAGQVKFKHLLSMTTGFVADVFQPGCVAKLDPPTGESDAERWTKCMTEIAQYEFRYKPGSVFNYGPWHLFVAVGGALNAAGQPLSKSAFVSKMKQIYTLSGLTTTPEFPESPSLPDVNLGLKVSANEWNAITHALTRGSILSAAYYEAFTMDHTTSVDKNLADSPSYDNWHYREIRADQALTGGWHYAQGHWILCDALATKDAQDKYIEGERYTWQQQNSQCGPGVPETTPNQRARHNVHHSVGDYGAFIWIDEANNYYGIYMQHFNWYYWLFAGTCMLVMASFCCCFASCGVAASVNYRRWRKEVSLMG